MGEFETTSLQMEYNRPKLDHEKLQSARATFGLGEWIVHPELNRISRGQRIVKLRPRVMDLLLVLAERPGRVVSRRDLVDTVWPGGFVADNTVTHAVQELRAALGDDSSAPSYLETVHRKGYRLVVNPVATPHSHEEPMNLGARFMLIGGGAMVVLVDGENRIGRDRDVQVFLDSVKVSRHHSRIMVNDDTALIEDLNSKNGTLLNGVTITMPTPLARGDRIRIGDVEFEFKSCGVEEKSTVAHIE